MTSRSLLMLLSPLSLALACNDTALLEIEHEGDEPGECSDGADQDRDDLFDCDDPDCAGSEECQGTDGTDGTDGADGTGGSDGSDGSVDLAPTPPGVSIEPERPRDGEDLSCVVSTPSEDPDGDPVSYRYRWTRSGAEVGTEAQLPAAVTAEGDELVCTVTPQAAGLDGLPGSASTTVVPDCLVQVDEDFAAGWGDFGERAGDASWTGSAARLFRTSTQWAMASAVLAREEPGALSVSARLVLREGTASFADEAQVVLCMTDDTASGVSVPGVSASLGRGVCLALSNETQNGSSSGAMLLSNTAFDNGGSGRRIVQSFTPSLNAWTLLEAERDLDGVWTFWVDGTSVGTWTEESPAVVRRLTLIGGQDTHAGYGGEADDVFFEGCP